MNNENLTAAAAHAEGCKEALLAAYKDSVKNGNGMAAYAIELTLRDVVTAMQSVNNLRNAAIINEDEKQ